MVQALSMEERFEAWYDDLWSLRDRRLDGWFLMESPLPTLLIVASYVYFVKTLGPRLMKDREPFNINAFMIVYNLSQVLLSAYMVKEVRIIHKY